MARVLAWSLLFLLTTGVPVAYADDPPPAPASNAALTEELARLSLQVQILEEQRKLLASSNAEGVTLPSGTIEFDANQVLPSAARYVTYQAFGDAVQSVCRDLGSQPQPLVFTDVDLRAIESQRLATRHQLEHLDARVKEASAAVGERQAAVEREAGRPLQDSDRGVQYGVTPKAATTLSFGAAPLLLGLDAVGAVGKSLAGLAGLFKTSYRVSSTEVPIGADVIRSALANCTGVRLADPAQYVIRDADLQIAYVDAVESSARALRQTLLRAKLAIPGFKQKIAEFEKGNAAARAGTLKSLVTELEASIGPAEARLAEAKAAIDKLYAVDDKSGISPLVALARMEALSRQYFSDNSNAVQAKVSVAYANGASRVSTAWWRNDRIEFSGGLAVTYTVQLVKSGDTLSSDTYFVQGTWKTLKVDSETTSGTLSSFKPKP
jgi:hypothetical protein